MELSDVLCVIIGIVLGWGAAITGMLIHEWLLRSRSKW